MTELIKHYKTGHFVDIERGIVYAKGKAKKQLGMTLNNAGYCMVAIGPKGATTSTTVHRMVMECFLDGPIEPGKDVDHRNAIKTDNRIANLQLVTRSENAYLAHQMTKAREEAASLSNVVRCEIVKTEHTKAEEEWAEELGVSALAVRVIRNYADLALSGAREVSDFIQRRAPEKIAKRSRKRAPAKFPASRSSKKTKAA